MKQGRHLDTWSYPCVHTTDIDALLSLPHYSNDDWYQGQLLYGREQKSDGGDYSDRLWQADYQKADRVSRELTDEGFRPRTARRWQEFVSRYYGKPCAITYIIGQVNQSNGYELYYIAWNWMHDETS